MHQDAAYWPDRPPVGGLAAMLAIDPAGPDNGGLELVPGRHDRLLTPEGEPADLDPSELPGVVSMTLDAGDLVIFSLLTPHQSGPNRSSRQRRALFFTYSVDDGSDQRTPYYAEIRRRLLDQLPPERRERALLVTDTSGSPD